MQAPIEASAWLILKRKGLLAMIGSAHYIETKMLFERHEISIVVQQGEPVLHDERGDQAINGLAYSDALAAQEPKVLSTLQSNLDTADSMDWESKEGISSSLKVILVSVALQNLAQDHVAQPYGSLAKGCVQQVGLGCDHTVEVMDPN
jgi:hypothetical protein